MLIREVVTEDAERFLQLIKEVENKSEFMLYKAGERKMTADKQRQQIEIITKQPNATILIAEEKGDFCGYLMVIGGNAQRKKHTAYIVVGVLDEYRGKGIGTLLFQKLDAWSITHKIVRLELTVVTQNEAGVNLYKKMGYEIEGTKKKSLMIDGTVYDEYYMAKLR
ncbi:GNAT family N-acetyltransferase [Bacillus sp. EAC]|uniref:GNAT family N-acetyltransferase n=1 Tax=Bacillus sp. EAC TaxID=1978338 RepID=UPI000B43A406|nr:GNAT family N-acetyltransferase [Bacillus sp. EAC]